MTDPMCERCFPDPVGRVRTNWQRGARDRHVEGSPVGRSIVKVSRCGKGVERSALVRRGGGDAGAS